MALSHGAKEPLGVTSGLVLYLDAANARSYPKSGTTWFDRSGNGNNGTLTNGPTYNSSNYGSLVFNGTSNYVDLGILNLLPTGVGTVCCWVKITNPTSGINNYVITKGNDTSSNINWGLDVIVSSSVANVYFLYGTATWVGSDSFNFSTSIYYHITAVANANNTQKIYINSTDLTQTSNPSYLGNKTVITPTASLGFTIGKQSRSSPNEYFTTGNISQVSIYNRSLSAAEVKQNYDVFKGRYGLT